MSTKIAKTVPAAPASLRDKAAYERVQAILADFKPILDDRRGDPVEHADKLVALVDKHYPGREAARKSLAATGKTHRGKLSLGQSPKADASVVIQWRQDNQASISATAKHFGLSDATVKRYAAAMRD